MRTLYTAALYAIVPFAWLRLAWRARRDRDYLRHPGERLGFGRTLAPGGIWVHAVSVGEVQAALPLVDLLLERRSEPVLLTTTTPSGRRRGASLFADRVERCYLPWDLPGAVRRFLARTAPRAVVVLETEIWPNLIHACADRSIPLVYVNARLSASSARGYRRFRRLFAPALARVSAVAAQTPDDAGRLVAAGAGAERVTVTGNTKFDVEAPVAMRESGESLRRRMAGAERGVWVAASTHEGEEELVLDAFARVRAESKRCVLLLAPRHVERAARVAALVRRRGFEASLRTAGYGEEADVVVCDTMGELPALYAASDVAFVGGSLVDVGGHNLLEPAVLGVPVVTGPHVRNFADIAASLEAAGAACVVRGAEELADTVARLLRDPNRRHRMGEEGRAFVLANRGARDRAMAVIEPWLDGGPAA